MGFARRGVSGCAEGRQAGDRRRRRTGLRQELASLGAPEFLWRTALTPRNFGPRPVAPNARPVTGIGFVRRTGNWLRSAHERVGTDPAWPASGPQPPPMPHLDKRN